MSSTSAHVAIGIEAGMALAGVILFWHLVLKRDSWTRRNPIILPRWEMPISDFLLFIFLIIGGSFLTGLAANLIARQLFLHGDGRTVLTGAAAQLGMLGGAWFFWSKRERSPPAMLRAQPNIFLAGAATFLVSLPILLIVANVWEFLLKLLGLPTEKQSLIEMFANADSPWLLGIMIALAVVIAPLTEELVFRAGLFRYFRSRVPRIAAIGVSAVIFAALHVNWETLEGLTSLAPLATLAVMFSLAYERTAVVGTSIVAHALFNANTILLIFSGLGKE